MPCSAQGGAGRCACLRAPFPTPSFSCQKSPLPRSPLRLGPAALPSNPAPLPGTEVLPAMCSSAIPEVSAVSGFSLGFAFSVLHVPLDFESFRNKAPRALRALSPPFCSLPGGFAGPLLPPLPLPSPRASSLGLWEGQWGIPGPEPGCEGAHRRGGHSRGPEGPCYCLQSDLETSCQANEGEPAHGRLESRRWLRRQEEVEEGEVLLWLGLQPPQGARGLTSVSVNLSTECGGEPLALLNTVSSVRRAVG